MPYYICTVTPGAFSVIATTNVRAVLEGLMVSGTWYVNKHTDHYETIQSIRPHFIIPTEISIADVMQDAHVQYIYICYYISEHHIHYLTNIATECDRDTDVDDALMILYSIGAAITS